jgi:hypothetical protein
MLYGEASRPFTTTGNALRASRAETEPGELACTELAHAATKAQPTAAVLSTDQRLV